MNFEQVALVVLAQFAAALLSGAIGMGGGAFMTAALSTIVPVNLIIPLQNMMLLANGGTRIWMFRHAVNWSLAWPFMVGLALGALVGTQIYTTLPLKVIELVIACGMLWLAWGPQKHLVGFVSSVPVRIGLGSLHGFISSLTSVGGILQSTFASLPLKKDERNGTLALIMTASNIFKAIGFALAGFALADYWLLLLLSLPTGYLGSWLGKRFLDQHISEHTAQLLFKGIVTLAALKLLWQFFY